MIRSGLLPQLWLVLPALLAFGPEVVRAQAPDRPLPVAVAVEKTVVAHDRGGGKTSDRLRLDITLDNRNRVDLKGLKLVWKILARDVRSRSLVAQAGASQGVNLPAGTLLVLRTDPVTFTEIDEKFTPGQNNRPGKTTPASGRKYRGFFVELYSSDSKLITRTCSPGMDNAAAQIAVPRSKPAWIVRQDPPPPPKPPAKPPPKPAAKKK